jgi:pimeloyl-ACP methyl ester carboxylesterase
LVHGAWHGAWCWSEVAARLREAGHTVATPTLTGLGTDAAALSRDVGLATHVDDVETALRQCNDVVLVGHSYAGMPVAAAAARCQDRLRHVVVVDGFLPEQGESALELLPEHAAAHYRDSAVRRGDGWRVPPRPLANLGVTDEAIIEDLEPRLTDHPLRTYQDRSGPGAGSIAVPGTYLLCVGWSSPFRWAADRAAALGWTVDELDADHEVPVTKPLLLAERLLTVGADAAVEEANA